jgi:hypothetical protein
MSSKPCPKRRRCLPSNNANLRSSIVASFRVLDSIDPDAFPRTSFDDMQPCHARSLDRSHSDIVLGNLACVSTETGASSYRFVVDGLRNRSISPCAVVKALVEDESVEDVAPMCWIIMLLEGAELRTTDFDAEALAQRCRIEVSSSSSKCTCPRAKSSGFQSFIETILMDGPSHSRDAILEALIKPLVVGGRQFIRCGSRDFAFLLAARTLDVLKISFGEVGDFQDLVKRWTQNSIEVTGELGPCSDGANSSVVGL